MPPIFSWFSPAPPSIFPRKEPRPWWIQSRWYSMTRQTHLAAPASILTSGGKSIRFAVLGVITEEKLCLLSNLIWLDLIDLIRRYQKFGSIGDLRYFLDENCAIFNSSYGVLRFLYSVILSKVSAVSFSIINNVRYSLILCGKERRLEDLSRSTVTLLCWPTQNTVSYLFSLTIQYK